MEIADGRSEIEAAESLESLIGIAKRDPFQMSNGSDFGMPGYVRFNFGCTYAMLEEGLERMNRAMQAWRASTA